MRTAVVVGNPKPGSRTLGAALAVADAVDAALGGEPDRLVIDVATLGPGLLGWGDRDVAAATEQVAASDLLIVASPTFKATYTGLLKLFLDQYGTDGLAGCVGVPVMTGAAPVHTLAPEVHLRPLLVELGCSVPSRGLFIPESAFADLASAIDPWAERAVPTLRRALA